MNTELLVNIGRVSFYGDRRYVQRVGYFLVAEPLGHQGKNLLFSPGIIWTQTVPGKGWLSLLRLYSPTEAWFDKTRRPGEIELVK